MVTSSAHRSPGSSQVKSECCSRNRTGVLKTVFYVCVCVHCTGGFIYMEYLYMFCQCFICFTVKHSEIACLCLITKKLT